MAHNRTRVSGVGARLLIVIFGIGGVAALVAGAAVYAFVEVGHSLALIDSRVDPILASVEVSRTVERIVTSASALSAATTEQRRERLFSKLSRQSTKLQSLLTDLRDGGISPEQLAPIEVNAVHSIGRQSDGIGCGCATAAAPDRPDQRSGAGGVRYQ